MDDEREFGSLPSDSMHPDSSGAGEPPSVQLSDEELYGPNAPPGVLPLPEPPRTADRIPARYRSSAGASIMAAGLLGLRDVIEPPKDDRPVVEQHVDGDEPDRAIQVFLDPDDPSRSMVVVRDPVDDN